MITTEPKSIIDILDAADYCEEVASKLPELGNKLCEEVCKVGVDMINRQIPFVVYDGDFTYKTYFNKTNAAASTRYKVTFESDEACFIEFGTGVTYPAVYPTQVPEEILPRGKYGKKKASNPNGWVYVGEAGTNGELIATKKDGRKVYRTKGNPSNEIVWLASAQAERKMPEIAKKVFKEVSP